MAKAGSKYAMKQQAKQSGKWTPPNPSPYHIPYDQKNENIDYFREKLPCIVHGEKKALAWGAYYCPPGSKFLYSAIHVEYENGRKDTVRAAAVKFE